jgi:hypothetical protein
MGMAVGHPSNTAITRSRIAIVPIPLAAIVLDTRINLAIGPVIVSNTIVSGGAISLFTFGVYQTEIIATTP